MVAEREQRQEDIIICIYERKVIRKIYNSGFQQKREKVDEVKIQQLYTKENIVQRRKSSRLTWTEYVYGEQTVILLQDCTNKPFRWEKTAGIDGWPQLRKTLRSWNLNGMKTRIQLREEWCKLFPSVKCIYFNKAWKKKNIILKLSFTTEL